MIIPELDFNQDALMREYDFLVSQPYSLENQQALATVKQRLGFDESPDQEGY